MPVKLKIGELPPDPFTLAKDIAADAMETTGDVIDTVNEGFGRGPISAIAKLLERIGKRIREV